MGYGKLRLAVDSAGGLFIVLIAYSAGDYSPWVGPGFFLAGFGLMEGAVSSLEIAAADAERRYKAEHPDDEQGEG